MRSLSYLCSPYSHPSPKMRELRAQQAMEFYARLRAAGYIVYCPIAHSHEASEYMAAHGLPVMDSEWWREENEAFLAHCDLLIVLCLDGWEQSKGVTREIEFAERRGMRVLFLGYSAEIPEAA